MINHTKNRLVTGEFSNTLFSVSPIIVINLEINSRISERQSERERERERDFLNIVEKIYGVQLSPPVHVNSVRE